MAKPAESEQIKRTLPLLGGGSLFIFVAAHKPASSPLSGESLLFNWPDIWPVLRKRSRRKRRFLPHCAPTVAASKQSEGIFPGRTFFQLTVDQLKGRVGRPDQMSFFERQLEQTTTSPLAESLAKLDMGCLVWQT